MTAPVAMTITPRDEDLMRFANKVLLPDDLNDKLPCWLWQGAKHSKKRGYGKFRLTVNGKSQMINAHKASYLLFNGPVNEGQVIGHTCNNEACVSPHHLRAETQKENMEYCMASGRHNSQTK